MSVMQKITVGQEKEADGDDGDKVLRGGRFFDNHVPCHYEHQHFQKDAFGWLAQQFKELDADHDTEDGRHKFKECAGLPTMGEKRAERLPEGDCGDDDGGKYDGCHDLFQEQPGVIEDGFFVELSKIRHKFSLIPQFAETCMCILYAYD